MRRTLALYPVPALLVATAWLRLEDGPGDSRVLWLVVLALVPALVRAVWLRAAVAVGAAFAAVAVAVRQSPLDARPFDGRHDFFGPAFDRVRDGVLAFYEVAVPFPALGHPRMHDAVLVAIFGFCLVIALALAARRPLVAGMALLAGSIWPATLVPGSDLARGTITLGVVLALLAAGRERPPRSYRSVAVAGAALAAAAVAASTSAAVAKSAFLDWQRWDFYNAPAPPVDVRYVWDAQYGGIHFPRKVTVVLRIAAPRESRYWRATTLDLFAGDRWRERLDERYRSSSEVALPDPLFPHAARQTVDWTRADVHVEAFRDPHLVGGSMPVAFESGDVGSIRYLTGNVAVAERPLERGDDYSVWSYVPHPTPRQLARARGRAPALVNRYREIAPGVLAPRFGARGRSAALRRLFQRRALAPYRPLYTAAQRVVGHPRNAYAAVVALEAWFRSDGHFTYDEQPPPALFAPPLVDFVTRTRRGYCQHFAGAMALMLRYLGIPARVAAGFTTGSYDLADGVWTVTDHDAHAWVEVWFPRYGWLPFDPTPGRGPLSGSYSSASTAFDPAGAAAALGAVAGEHARDFTSQLARKYQASLVGHDRPGDLAAAPPTESHRGASLLRLLALVAAVAVAGMALVKLALRKARYLTRDPRRLAAACVRELVEFVADQGLDVPRSATISEAGTLVGRRLAVDTRAFVHAANTTRFAPPHAAEVSARQARKELRRVLRAVRRRVGIVRRVRGTVSLRSLAA